ncbi:hypothetical protein ACFOOK_17375 [Micromonospora krabiensis]|uniref:Agenet domain-containing protein n=1 Tax=Micromonospora krabiensis TaxID=307121 RepID=A0A1C3MZL2_9ACTN|nr:hypothetical protein [Micromonospora krabiensis]SBV25783.1 hypothetical protein GA0070620_1263 [Micromonospora krabiensis]
MSAPSSPSHATPTGATPPDVLCEGARVWVRRDGSWRPGIVLCSNASAATVRYRPAETIGTGVDTVVPRSLRPRHDDDPYLDKATVADPDRPAPALATRTAVRPREFSR